MRRDDKKDHEIAILTIRKTESFLQGMQLAYTGKDNTVEYNIEQHIKMLDEGERMLTSKIFHCEREIKRLNEELIKAKKGKKK